ncbi:MAG: ribonuclease P protein component [Acidimicrobiales bacterium]
MLPPEHRLRHSQDFRAAVRRGVRVGRPLVVVHLVPGSDESGPTRAGFAVGRVVGGAVVRNAVRRRLRHLMRDRLDRLPPGSRVVIRAQSEATGAPGVALARDLDAALDRALARVAGPPVMVVER